MALIFQSQEKQKKKEKENEGDEEELPGENILLHTLHKAGRCHGRTT